MFDLYQKITDQIIAHPDKGVIPWRCPWKCSTMPPQNMISKRPYRGINAFLLNLAPYKQPYWLTMRQVNHLGGHVRKDENATILNRAPRQEEPDHE
jgi:antirestriction protein ArdC